MANVKPRQWHRFYLLAISALGLYIVFLGLVDLFSARQLLNLVLLLVLAAVSEVMATYFTIENSNIAYEVGTAVGLAAVPFYGPGVAVLIVTASSISFWLYITRSKPLKARNWSQLLFNIGMHSLATYIAGSLFIAFGVQDQLISLRAIGVWIISAIVYDQINLWLLIGLLNLMHGKKFKPTAFWRENRWAMVVNIVILAVGGFFLSSALDSFQWVGIVIFFLPILLSSLSFQLYVRKMKAYTENLEALVAERTRELSDLMREKDAFLTVLTHDMKTPLTSIGLYAGLLAKQPEILAEKPHLPFVILRGQRTLTEIVNNIVDIGKLQTMGELPLSTEEVDLIPVIEHAAEMMEAQAARKNIKLTLINPAATILLRADRQQLERVLQNLMSNAVKYTPQNGAIELSLVPEKERVQIIVKDNGYGIPEDELSYIFDRYRRVSGHEKVASGTGLGLAITKAIVEAHDGEIWVESVVNEGSTFTVVLPIDKVTFIINKASQAYVSVNSLEDVIRQSRRNPIPARLNS